ncbi:MAG: HAD-IIB family hydrolase [Candidatus Sedimenticola sp. 20ELBAFRAG]
MSSPRLLLCTDLDRTLLPNGSQPESPQARHRFAALASHPGISLVFVSGRDKALIEQAITNYQLPMPDFVISDVGTNIYDMRGGKWQVWQQWQDEIAPDWKGYSQLQISDLLSDINELRMQELSKQNRFKLSYYVPLYVDKGELNQQLEKRLLDHEINASLVWSVDEPAGIGLLDILPMRATKLHAVEFLQAYLGTPRSASLFAGDSGNDLPVLASTIPSVLVANAMHSVAKDALAAAREANNLDYLYLAKGGFLGMNGNYSAGILEGVAHYHPELVELFAACVEQ